VNKTAAPLSVGTLLASGRYQIQQVLGQGGFAITYRAVDTRLIRAVALKELCPQGCTRDAHNQVVPAVLTPTQFAQVRQRFVEEARIVAQLNHPGIVRIHDVFEQNNTGYIVMEYLRGETLSAKLKRAGGVLPVEEAVGYILQVCEALRVVHQAGYIHRDIKPDNVVHCEDGRIVLIDFGTARQFANNHTAVYTVIFTPSYAAPEQYSSLARLDPRTDIYGLSAMLYHLVTGIPPLGAAERMSGLELPPPHLVEPRVGNALSQTIMQGLALRMDERPPSIEAFLHLLRGALETAFPPQTPTPSGQTSEVSVAQSSPSQSLPSWSLPQAPDTPFALFPSSPTIESPATSSSNSAAQPNSRSVPTQNSVFLNGGKILLYISLAFFTIGMAILIASFMVWLTSP